MSATKSIVSGVTILSVTGIICKLIGVFFRVPLVWLVGEGSVGIYQLVFPTYTMLLTISSAGLPVAVSHMVSANLSRGDPVSAKRVFKLALWLLAGMGIVLSVVMALMSGWLSESFVHDPETLPGFIAIAPSVFIVCVLSAYRGFMQGQQNMMPTAISQLIEQVLKVAFALPLAYAGQKISMAYAAAGALLGTSITEAAALFYMMILYKKRNAAYDKLPVAETTKPQTDRSILRQLASSALPITLGASIVPLSGFVDSSMIMSRLAQAGIATSAARELYGSYSGCVINLINVPTALAIAIAMSLVPAISSAWAANDKVAVQRQSTLGLRFSFLIGLPCSAGMSILAAPLLHFVFGRTLAPENFSAAVDLLTVSALTIVLFTVVQATSGILQGLKKQKIPLYTLAAGVAIKILLNAILIPIPGMNIHGAPIASIFCYAVSMIPNLIYVIKHTGMTFDYSRIIIRPLAATLIMSAAVFALNRFLPDGSVSLLICVTFGILVFALSAFALKAVTKDDLRAFARRRRHA